MAPYLLAVKNGDKTIAFVNKNGWPCKTAEEAMQLHFRENIEYYQKKYAPLYKSHFQLVIESAPR